MSALKLVRPAKHDKAGASREQRRQREMAWNLYIAEGLVANLENSLRWQTNLTGPDKHTLRVAIQRAKGLAAALRVEV